MAFLPGWLQSTDAAPDDGFAAAIVPVNSAEHLTAFAANDNLCKAVVAAVGALFAISTCIDHSPVDYDKNSATTRRFYATVQNKMHYAVHGHTDAELIVERADHTKEHMGLTTWADAPEGKIKKSDVTVAKRKKEGIFCEDSVVQRLMKAEW